MTYLRLIHLAIVVASAVLTLIALLAAGEAPDSLAVGMMVPFGWPRVAVVQVLAGLPLAVLLAALVRRTARKSSVRGIAGVWAVLGIMMTVIVIRSAAATADLLYPVQIGFTIRLLVRVMWCLSLELPWCLFAQYLCGPLFHDAPTRGARAIVWALTLVATFGLPAAYTSAVIDGESKTLDELLKTAHLRRAQLVAERLCAVGSAKTVNGRTPDQIRRDLEMYLFKVWSFVIRPLPQSAPIEARVSYARGMALLGRQADAIQILQQMPQSNIPAILLLAAIQQDEERWDESTENFRCVLAQLDHDANEAATANCIRAFDGIAHNALKRGAPIEAVNTFEQALKRLPNSQAHFHLRLGKHFQQMGRPGMALAHLEMAEQIGPAHFAAQAQTVSRELHMQTPGCLLGLPLGRSSDWFGKVSR